MDAKFFFQKTKPWITKIKKNQDLVVGVLVFDFQKRKTQDLSKIDFWRLYFL